MSHEVSWIHAFKTKLNGGLWPGAKLRFTSTGVYDAFTHVRGEKGFYFDAGKEIFLIDLSGKISSIWVKDNQKNKLSYFRCPWFPPVLEHHEDSKFRKFPGETMPDTRLWPAFWHKKFIPVRSWPWSNDNVWFLKYSYDYKELIHSFRRSVHISFEPAYIFNGTPLPVDNRILSYVGANCFNVGGSHPRCRNLNQGEDDWFDLPIPDGWKLKDHTVSKLGKIYLLVVDLEDMMHIASY